MAPATGPAVSLAVTWGAQPGRKPPGGVPPRPSAAAPARAVGARHGSASAFTEQGTDSARSDKGHSRELLRCPRSWRTRRASCPSLSAHELAGDAAGGVDRDGEDDSDAAGLQPMRPPPTVAIAVMMPTTWPMPSTSAPPELPGCHDLRPGEFEQGPSAPADAPAAAWFSPSCPCAAVPGASAVAGRVRIAVRRAWRWPERGPAGSRRNPAPAGTG